MPDLRRDPIVGRWVIISTERSGRPHDFTKCSRPDRFRLRSVRFARDKNGSRRKKSWPTVRSPPKRMCPIGPCASSRISFLRLQVEGDMGREGLGLYDRMNGIGAHEVIIETPGHKDSLADCRPRRSKTCSGPIATASSI